MISIMGGVGFGGGEAPYLLIHSILNLFFGLFANSLHPIALQFSLRWLALRSFSVSASSPARCSLGTSESSGSLIMRLC